MRSLINSMVLLALILPLSSARATSDTEGNVPNVLQIICGDGDDAKISGSGVVVEESLIITNSHVMFDENGDAYEFCIGGWSETAYSEPDNWVVLTLSEFFRYDDYFDYAFLYPYDEDGDLYEFDSFATLANADSMQLSEDVTIIGYPGTTSTITITEGTLSGFQGSNWIKVDARIDAGNSGGGAFDIAGNLFGVPTAVSGVYSSSLGWVQNINAILEDAFGDAIAIRDYSSLYEEENQFCLSGDCYQFSPDEESWETPTSADEHIDDEIVQNSETLLEDGNETHSSISYSLPDHADYSQENFSESLQERLKGYILLQTQQHGEAWYVLPADGLRYYMRDGEIAYEMMRSFGLGIADEDLEGIPSVESATDMLDLDGVCSSNELASRLKGQILLQVEQHGEAWYVHPTLCYRIYLKDGDAAYDTMRYLSLGVSDVDLAKLPFSSTMEFK